MDKREYREVAALAANGGTKEFARLYETIYREMYYAAFYSLKNDADAIEAVTGTIKDGFSAIGRLHSEAAFRTFMMRSLCARIKLRFKEYSAAKAEKGVVKGAVGAAGGGFDVKREFERLSDGERLVTALYVAGKFLPDEISSFTGYSVKAIKKQLSRVLDEFALD